MLVDLGKEVYARDFERPFLERSAEFYQREAAELLAQSTAPDYLRRAERRLNDEDERVKLFLGQANRRLATLARTPALPLALTPSLFPMYTHAHMLARTSASPLTRLPSLFPPPACPLRSRRSSPPRAPRPPRPPRARAQTRRPSRSCARWSSAS
jgi:hypothetical protein